MTTPKEIESYFNKAKKFQTFLFYGNILVMSCVWILILRGMVLSIWTIGLLLLAMGGIIVLNYSNKQFRQYGTKLLYDELNLDGYVYFYSLQKVARRRDPHLRSLSEGIAAYFRGHFQKSQDNLSKVQIKNFRFTVRQLNKESLAFYHCLNAIKLAEKVDLSEFSQYVWWRRVEDYLTIETGGIVEDFEDAPQHKLSFILQTYYRAKNAINTDKPDQARELFESIKDENPELFMVQEAREYLNKG